MSSGESEPDIVMNQKKQHLLRAVGRWTGVVLLVAVVVGGLLTWQRWLPLASHQVRAVIAVFRSGSVDAHAESPSEEADPHAGHAHGPHEAHEEESSLQLSDKAMRNIGLTPESIRPVRLEVFRRTISVPAVVVEKPGRTRLEVATPMTGAVTRIHAVEGEAVDPGALLFQIRLTHEDLVQAQTRFVQTLGELDVEKREIVRLTEITQSGAVAGKTLLEHKYAEGRLTALLRAQREALRLHGLSDAQVDSIVRNRRLLRELQMSAPFPDQSSADELQLSRTAVQPTAFSRQTGGPAAAEPESSVPLILQNLNAHVGQSVDAGETLCVLTDFSTLYIEGMAFEYDIARLRHASQQGWDVVAVMDRSGSSPEIVDGLSIAYLANEIDPDSRTLPFYVDLPNRVTSEHIQGERRFVEWQYFPGQRMQLQIPVEEWPDRIVLPVDAVASEGAESFVFRQNGSRFDRVAVHVEYRDQHSVVVANDGTVFPGDVIAMSGAHQMQMALKNKAGGAPDPHAGHNH